MPRIGAKAATSKSQSVESPALSASPSGTATATIAALAADSSHTFPPPPAPAGPAYFASSNPASMNRTPGTTGAQGLEPPPPPPSLGQAGDDRFPSAASFHAPPLPDVRDAAFEMQSHASNPNTLPQIPRSAAWLAPGASYRNGSSAGNSPSAGPLPPHRANSAGVNALAVSSRGDGSSNVMLHPMAPDGLRPGYYFNESSPRTYSASSVSARTSGQQDANPGTPGASTKAALSPSALAASTAAGRYRTAGEDQGTNGTSSHSPENSVDENGLNPPPLRRNQACLSCRKRKLKCDAVRPVCGTCAKSRVAAAQSKHPAPIPAGDCVYTESNTRERGGGSRKRGRPSTASAADGEESFDGSRPQKAAHTGSSGGSASQPRVADLEDRIKYLENLLVQMTGERDLSSAQNKASTGAISPAQTIQPGDGTSPQQAAQNSPGTWKSPLAPEQISAKEDAQWRNKANEWKREMGPLPPRTMHSDTRPSSSRSGNPAVSAGTKSSHLPHQSDMERNGFGYTARVKFGVTQSTSDTNATQLFELDGISPETTSTHLRRAPAAVIEPDPLLELLWPGWPSDLPSPDTVLHLAEIFFSRHALSCMIYKPSFMTSLSLPPRHPDHPDAALIHAILAAAAPLSPYFTESRPGTRFPSPAPGAKGDCTAGGHLFELCMDDQPEDTGHDPKMSFAEFHLSRARRKTAMALVTRNHNPSDWLQACVLTTDTLFNHAKILESYLLGGFVARSLAPAGLTKLRHYSEPVSTLGLYMPPPRTAPEEHERRMTFWSAYILEANYVNAGNYFESSTDDNGVTTSLPSSVADFQAGREPEANPQTLASEDLFESGHIDDFNLNVKSAILLKRVKYLLARNDCYRDVDVLNRIPQKPPGFRELDANITQLLATAPPLDDPNNTDRMCCRLGALSAMATLHEPFVDVKDPNSYSYKRLEYTVKETLKVVDLIDSQSFDASLIIPRSSLMFVTAARMIAGQIEFLRTIGNQEDAVEVLYHHYDRIGDLLGRMATKSRVALRAAQQLKMFRSGQWDETYLTKAVVMSGVLPDNGEEERPAATSRMY